MNEANQELFEKYLSGALSTDEKDAFEIRLKEEKQFKNDFELFNSMDQFLTDNAEHREALDSIKTIGLNMRANETRNKSTNNILKLLIAIAAIGMVLFASNYFNQKPKSQEFKQYAEVYEEPIWPETRTESSYLGAIISNYKKGNKKAAFDSLYISKKIPSPVRQYWLAELHLLENNADSSLFYIPKAMRYSLKQDRLFYLEVLVNLKLNNTIKLDSIIKSPPKGLDPYYLKKIEALKN